MNRNHTPSDENWEQDRVWDLIDRSHPQKPSGRFVDDTVRAARLSGQPKGWGARSWAWGSLTAGLLGAAAALVFSLLPPVPGNSHPPVAIDDFSHAQEIGEIAETEVLIAAVEHMEEFSDRELVTLIGF